MRLNKLLTDKLPYNYLGSIILGKDHLERGEWCYKIKCCTCDQIFTRRSGAISQTIKRGNLLKCNNCRYKFKKGVDKSHNKN